MSDVRVSLVAAAVFAWAALAGQAEAVDRALGADIARPAAMGSAWTSDATNRLTHDIDGLLGEAATLRGAHVGLIAIDSRTGTVLYAQHADDAFAPASTLKLLTGSVALASLTPQYRFRTQALFDPTDTTLYVRAGGDPFLKATDLDAMAQAVRSAGITTLSNGVRIDSSAFDAAPYPPGWVWDDFPYDYAAMLSAATVEENVVHLTVAPGATVGALGTVSGGPAPFEHLDDGSAGCSPTDAIVVRVMARTVEASRVSDADIDLERSGGCIVVSGLIPLGSSPQELDAAVPDPRWYLQALAQYSVGAAQISIAAPRAAAGLTVGAKSANANADVSANAIAGPNASANGNVSANAELAPAGARVVWTHDGEALSDLLADMWWPSDNLAAELVLKAIARQERGEPGTTANGLVAERAWLTRIGIDPATVTIADGSGLSTYDRLTPRALGAILQADWNGPFRDIVVDDLPLAGVRGTLARSFVGSVAERRTFAKTGSMNHTRGLAGYLATLHHGALTFAWSIDDWLGSDADLEALRARVLARFIDD